MVTDRSTTTNDNNTNNSHQNNTRMKRYDNYVATAAEKLRQRLIELQAQRQPQAQSTCALDTDEPKNTGLPNEIRQLKEQLKVQLEQADKYYSAMQSKHVANGYHDAANSKRMEESDHRGQQLASNNHPMANHNNDSVHVLEKELAMLRESLAKYQNMHPQSIMEEDNVSYARKTLSSSLNASSPQIKHNETKECYHNDKYPQTEKSRPDEEEDNKLRVENARQQVLQAQKEYEDALQKLQMTSVSQDARKSADYPTADEMNNVAVVDHENKSDGKLLCPLHEYFTFSAPYIIKLNSYLQLSAAECEKQMTRLVQHSSTQEIKEMLFFCVDKIIQEMEVQQEEQQKISDLEQALARVQMENAERYQQQQEIENKLREELERCQSDLSKAELALDVARSEKLALESRTPTLELCETLETRLEKLENRRNKHEKELHRQIEEKNNIIEGLKAQIANKDKETSRLYAEVQHLLQNVEQLRKVWATQEQTSRSRRRR